MGSLHYQHLLNLRRCHNRNPLVVSALKCLVFPPAVLCLMWMAKLASWDEYIHTGLSTAIQNWLSQNSHLQAFASWWVLACISRRPRWPTTMLAYLYLLSAFKFNTAHRFLGIRWICQEEAIELYSRENLALTKEKSLKLFFLTAPRAWC